MRSHIGNVLGGVAVTVLAACGAGGDATATSFAAALDGSDAFVGVVLDQGAGRLLAYVCDGESVAAWFTGTAAADGSLSLTSAGGARQTGRVDGSRLSGTVVLPGAAHSFSSTSVTEPAGLYRTKGEVRGEPAVGGWIVLPDGTQRGAVVTSSGFMSTDADLARPDKPVTSFISTDTDL